MKELMSKDMKRGFTLIELLVVIAIIGILASVVLASLNSARSKGGDAAVKANLANMRAQAELYYDSNSNSYGTPTASSNTCTAGLFGDPTIAAAISSATNAAGGTAGTNRRCAIGVSGASWAASVPLNSSSTQSYCVDSSGAAKTEGSASPALGGNTVAAACP